MDDEDEWFFSSIKRYNQLQMFDFDKSAQDIDLSSQNNLCVALEGDRNGKCELLMCSLPETLQLKEGSNEITFDRHLSFNHGYFTETALVQMKCLPDKENVVISERKGVALYDVSCEDTDFFKKICTIPCSIDKAKLAVHPSACYIALCGTTSNHRSIIDYSVLTNVFDIVEEATEGDLSPNFLSSDVISFGNKSSGAISLYDIRSQKLVESVNIPDVIESTKSSISRWVFNSTYGIKSQSADFNNNLIYLLSTNGNFLLYDWRNLKEALHYSKHPFDCESKIGPRWDVKMCISPSNVNRFSVCGFDENVYICELKDGKIEVVFTHDGHPYSKDEFEANVTSVCALWIPFVTENTLASCADNTSLQCWQFLSK